MRLPYETRYGDSLAPLTVRCGDRFRDRTDGFPAWTWIGSKLAPSPRPRMRRFGLAACAAFCGFFLSTRCKRGSPGDSTLATRGSALREPSPGNASSCEELAATCGPSGKESCCRSLLVTGGSFRRGYDGVDFLDPQFAATVSNFYLDRYEVTVGRLRAFVSAGL